MIKRLLTRYWFTWANILLGFIGAFIFQKVKTPSDGNAVEFLIAFITMSISLLSWWLEYREMELLSEAQIMNYLDNQKLHKDITAVGKNKLTDIYRIKSELKDKCYNLTYPEMEKYTNDVVNECKKGFSNIKTYHAIHNVNASYFREVWEFRETAEAKRDEFIESQRDFLNNGGEIIRIFIFDRPYFLDNKPQCLKLLDDHEKYYENTNTRIITLATLFDPMWDAHLTYDYTIIGNKVSFEWKRRLDNQGYSNGLCYVSKGDALPKFYEDFQRLKLKSKTKNTFISIHSSQNG